MRIATTIPEVLHICPGCERELASEKLLCVACRKKNTRYLELVGAGVIDPLDGSEDPNLPNEVREFQEALATRLTLPGIAPELGAPVEWTRTDRAVLSTPERGSRLMDALWALAALAFSGGILCVLGVYQLWHDFRRG